MKKYNFISGLPRSGKTQLSNTLRKYLESNNKTVDWFNADIVREQFNDWDFSINGRIRQSIRMKELASNSKSDYVICDFIAPLPIMRDNVNPDVLIWVDTITEGRFDDTNKLFVPPEYFDIRVTEQDSEYWSSKILPILLDCQ